MANPNPNPATRFKPGQSGNPGGKTEGQRAAELEAARISAQLRLKAPSSLQERIDAGADILDLIDATTLRLFKDSEDRAHGTPKATNDLISSNGTVTPIFTTIYEAKG